MKATAVLSGMICGAWFLAATSVGADEAPVVVVELYTSQGCSSCPPADAYLAELANKPGVIALALHVDYWDYIGWTDQFASPHFTDRQKAYARAEGHRTIYTPQMIVGGVERIEGADPEKVESDIRLHQQGATGVSLHLEREGDAVAISATTNVPFPAPLIVQIVRYRPAETVSIGYGENAGQVLDYRNIVTEWSKLGDWSGAMPLMLSAPAKGAEPVVVILQEPGPGAILAAAELK